MNGGPPWWESTRPRPYTHVIQRSVVRRFEIHRDADVTGVSGTGLVAEGVEFPDGTTVVRWRVVSGVHADRGVKPTTVIHPDVQSVEALHGHNGATRLVWLD